MRKQFNVRLPEKLTQLIQKDAIRFSRPAQSIVEKVVSEFYTKKLCDREPTILLAAPRRGGKIHSIQPI
jgi:hypothetical protein